MVDGRQLNFSSLLCSANTNVDAELHGFGEIPIVDPAFLAMIIAQG
jgi:hypothetical protein